MTDDDTEEGGEVIHVVVGDPPMDFGDPRRRILHGLLDAEQQLRTLLPLLRDCHDSDPLQLKYLTEAIHKLTMLSERLKKIL